MPPRNPAASFVWRESFGRLTIKPDGIIGRYSNPGRGCKFQISSSKSQIKDQIPSFKMEDAAKARDLFWIWRLSFPWDLGIGI